MRIVVFGHYIVWYKSYNINDDEQLIGNDSGSWGVSIWESNEDGGGGGSVRVKVTVIYGVTMVCSIAIVLCVWLLKRSIINKAKVALFGFTHR